MPEVSIICINGVLCARESPVWPNIMAAFLQHLPDAVFHVEAEPYCHPFDLPRLWNLTRRIAEKCDDGVPTILVGHSMGGIVASAAANLFRHSRVLGLVTIFAPNFGVYPLLLGATSVPQGTAVVSFGGIYDEVWPCVWSIHPYASAHCNIPSSHVTGLVRNPKHAATIAEVTMREIRSRM